MAAVNLFRICRTCSASLETTGSLKTRSPQTVGVFAYLKLLFGPFCGARLREMAKKKTSLSSFFL
jgi:hypothetical protein